MAKRGIEEVSAGAEEHNSASKRQCTTAGVDHPNGDGAHSGSGVGGDGAGGRAVESSGFDLDAELSGMSSSAKMRGHGGSSDKLPRTFTGRLPGGPYGGGGMQRMQEGAAEAGSMTSLQFGAISPAELQAMGKENFPSMHKRVVEQLTGTVDMIHREHPRSASSHTEIEVRLGRKMGQRFHPGVAREFFEALAASLSADATFQVTKTEAVDYAYETEQGERMRITETTSDGGAPVLSAQRKQSLHKHDIPCMPRFLYDVRISASSEIKVQDPLSVPTNWISKRKKSRMSFRAAGGDADIWQMDLTVCEALSMEEHEADMEPTTTYEVEYELPLWCWGKIADPEFQTRMTRVLWDKLVVRIGRFNLFLDPLIHQQSAEIRRRCWQLVQGSDTVPHHMDFPGSMPVAFSRRSFAKLQSEHYFVSDKTDGVRYMILISSQGVVYMIDRKNTVFGVHHCPILPKILSNGDSLLDGEIVEHHGTKQRMFLVFDVLCFDGQYVGNLDLGRRLGCIGECIKRYRKKFEQLEAESASFAQRIPFVLMGKKFFQCNAQGMASLQRHIVRQDNERWFRDDKRFHMTDGAIFTPRDLPYKPKGCESLFKWKYPDLLSIDFQVCMYQGEYAFKCGGPHQDTIRCRNAKLLAEDQMKLDDMVEARRQVCAQRTGSAANYDLSHDTLIVECVYDVELGAWRVVRERPDKQKPNYITVCFDTMEACAENISEEELVYRICLGTHDDWPKRKSAFLANMKARALPQEGGGQQVRSSNG